MTTGLILLVLTGILWVAIGSIVSNTAQKNFSLALIQGVSALIMAVFSLPVIFFEPIEIPAISVIVLILSGVANSGTFLFMNKAMKYGPNGLTWAIIQSVFIMPFLMGIIFFGESCSPLRMTGIVIMAVATVGMGVCGKRSQSEKSGGQNKFKWIAFTFLSYIVAGMAQCFCNLPSYFIKEGEISFSNLLFRIGLCCIGIIVMSAVMMFIRHESDFRKKGTAVQAIILAVSSFLATITLFAAMDIMVQNNAGSISYPITVGVSIAAFILYTAIRLKERIKPWALFFVLLSLTGIAFIVL